MSDTKYVLRKSGGDIVECDRCGSTAPTTQTRWDDVGVDPKLIDPDRAPQQLLCMFCYETHLGTILQYRHHGGEAQTLARGLCQALNLVMDAVNRKRK